MKEGMWVYNHNKDVYGGYVNVFVVVVACGSIGV